MSVLHWVSQECPKPSWLVKTDDDTVHDMRMLGEVVAEMEGAGEEGVVAGLAMYSDPVFRPGLGLPEKWVVAVEEFPRSTYPTFCNGAFYLMAAGVGGRLLQVAPHPLTALQAFHHRGDKFFKLDDIFVTGILAQEAGVGHK